MFIKHNEKNQIHMLKNIENYVIVVTIRILSSKSIL